MSDKTTKNLFNKSQFDKDIYSEDSKANYTKTLLLNEDEEISNNAQDSGEAEPFNPEDFLRSRRPKESKLQSYTAPNDAFEEDINQSGTAEDELFKATNKRKIINREDDYKKKRYRPLSPERFDPLKDFDKMPDAKARTYGDIMLEQNLENERIDLMKQQMQRKKEQMNNVNNINLNVNNTEISGSVNAKQARFDSDQISSTSDTSHATKASKGSEWDKLEKQNKWETPKPIPGSTLDGMATPRRKRWDLTPVGENLQTPKINANQLGSATPDLRWNQITPKDRMAGDTPTPGRMKTKWDETPLRNGAGNIQQTPNTLNGATPTPQGAFNMPTPSPGMHTGMTPLGGAGINLLKLDKDFEERNRPLSDEDLDQMLPSEGYEIVKPPENYHPILTPSRKLITTPYNQTPLYQIPEGTGKPYEIMQIPGSANLPTLKPEDVNYFSSLLNEVDESKLTPEEQRDRMIMTLLLKVKNGIPPMRKSALRQLTERAREFGAGPLFNQILPLLMSPTLEDQERHLLVKVIDRILYKLDDLVRPYVHKILVVIEPLLIDEDYYARVEGREIISNLAKAAGLATMISTMRPDIDHSDEFVRNTTARAFAVVANALGIPSILPFLRAVCQSKKSWQARHTGIKIVQQIAILMGCAILPYLKQLVEIIENGLKDEQQKVRTMTALSIAALAEASAPYGIEAFTNVIRHLFDGMKQYKGKGLAAFFKAIGFIIPLMDAELAGRSTKLVIPILRREFQTPDEEMKKIILKVLKQCISTEGIEAQYVRSEIISDYFKYFWTRRMALDRKNYKQLVETTLEIANKVGGAEIIEKIIDYLKDENEPYRRMTLETIEKIVSTLGVADIPSRLEQLLIDGLIFIFQEQTSDDGNVILNGFGTIVNALNLRAKPYIPLICGTIQWRLTNKSAKIRQQAADLISKIAPVLKSCGEENLMGKLGVVLYEYLGEEYPEVLGSILGALKAIVNVIGMTKMTPPIKDLLPRLTPILKNRHEKVQENCIDLVGRIADRGASFVSAKEWMRICFDLLDLLKAQRKGIRRATVNTFGYIARAIGPQDVLVTLLNNLKVQERQNRVCTTVAIAIVSEICGPYTVIPALMNEYRVQELNVQNGVLKSFSFLFEYIGEMAKDYIYTVTPLLEDALTDRDLVHRQIASNAVKHLALGVSCLNAEDALLHLLNFVWPNIFETSPHVINAVMEAIEGLRVGLGVNVLMKYLLQGLFHPARRVRDSYWKIYNMMYVAAADAMVAAYPELPDELPRNTYRRTELELFI